jgi:hypothetical protein
MKLAALFFAVLLTWGDPASAFFLRGGAASSSSTPPPSTNAAYPLPLLTYAQNGGCGTNYYVSNGTGGTTSGSDSHTSAQAQNIATPWATITHAESTLAGTNPGACITVLPGTPSNQSVYAEDIILTAHGTTNTLTGWTFLRCAASATAATAQPALYAATNGASGSLPGCLLTNVSGSDVEQGGIVATSNGSTVYDYAGLDGFEISDITTKALTVSGLSYNFSTGAVTLTLSGITVSSCSYVSGTGVMTLNLASASGVADTVQFTPVLTGTGSIASANVTSTSTAANNSSTLTYNIATGLTLTCAGGTVYPAVLPRMGFHVAGLTGTGNIASANGYVFAQPGTGGASIIYNIAPGLTMSYSGGGTATYPDPNGNVICCYGSGVGSVGFGQGNSGYPYPAGHHLAAFNNYIHDMGGSCIQFEGTDVVYAVGNWVQNCGWTSPYQESGIVVGALANASYTAGALDGQLGTLNGHAIRNLIANNVANNNGNPLGQTDGNGIIFDTNNGTSVNCTVASSTYSYGTLDYGNLTYYNGGRGNHSFKSSLIAFYNNTDYDSIQSTLAAANYGIDGYCGSSNWYKDNISVATPGSGVQAGNHAAGSAVSSLSLLNNTVLWNNNILYNTTTPSACSSTNGTTACYNGTDIIVSVGTEPLAWSSSTGYSGMTNNANAAVLGSDGNVYTSLSSSTNLNHNPVTDAPTPGTQGSWWQNDGPPNNQFINPKISSPGGITPAWTLQTGSPGLGTSGSDTTALGGYTVSTPNIGAF